MAKAGTHKARALERLGDLSTIDPSLARAMIRVLKKTLGEDEKLPQGPISFIAFHDAMVAALEGFYSPETISYGDLKRTATVLATSLRSQEDLDAFSWWVGQQAWLKKDAALNRVINALSRSIVHIRVLYREHLQRMSRNEGVMQQAEYIVDKTIKSPRSPQTALPFAPKVIASSHG